MHHPPTEPLAAPPHLQQLLTFNQQLLAQAQTLVAAHTAPAGPRYAGPTGSHLRHVIEHHEALLFPAQPGVVDYDARPRDALLEASPAVASSRLLRLQRALAVVGPAQGCDRLVVRGLGGLAGEFDFEVPSSFARELAFVASHAVHHYALLRPQLQAQGLALPDGFGRAPATRAHERALAGAG